MSPSTVPEPEVVDLEGATTAVIRGVVPMAELVNFFDRSFSALTAAISSQGVEITRPAFCLYHGPPTDVADLEVGFATARAVRPDGDVEVGSLPGGRVARLVHRGSYDQLVSAWERLGSWIDERGLTRGPVLWEVYVTQPSPDMDPADLLTELNWPIS